MVLYEVKHATDRFLSYPIANVVFSTQAELPMVTICQDHPVLKLGPLPSIKTHDWNWGKYYPDDKEGFL